MKRIQEILSDPRVRVVDSGPDGAAFYFSPRPGDKQLRVIASDGAGWDHVSVSTCGSRTPSWAEMDAVKRLCFRPDETAMQLHPREANHISIKHNCLHIWRPQGAAIPMPPVALV